MLLCLYCTDCAALRTAQCCPAADTIPQRRPGVKGRPEYTPQLGNQAAPGGRGPVPRPRDRGGDSPRTTTTARHRRHHPLHHCTTTALHPPASQPAPFCLVRLSLSCCAWPGVQCPLQNTAAQLDPASCLCSSLLVVVPLLWRSYRLASRLDATRTAFPAPPPPARGRCAAPRAPASPPPRLPSQASWLSWSSSPAGPGSCGRCWSTPRGSLARARGAPCARALTPRAARRRRQRRQRRALLLPPVARPCTCARRGTWARSTGERCVCPARGAGVFFFRILG